MAHYDVAAMLLVEFITEALESFNCLGTRNDRKLH